MKLGQRRPDLAYAAKMAATLVVSLPVVCVSARMKESGALSPGWGVLIFFGALGSMLWSLGYFMFNSNELDDEWRRTRRCKKCGQVPRSKKRDQSIKLECACGTRYLQSSWTHFEGDW